MGELFLHDLNGYISNGNKTFVETGTGKGTGIEYAKKHDFTKLYSIEIMEVLYQECVRKFGGDDRINLINDNSIDGLSGILPIIKNEKTVFWLDAHFPGADFQLGGYDDEHPKHIKNPLEAEINIITTNKDTSQDVFILDDLGLYEPGKYQMSNAKLKEYREKLGLNNQFIYDKFQDTHNIRKDFRHQGFLIMEPKNEK